MTKIDIQQGLNDGVDAYVHFDFGPTGAAIEPDIERCDQTLEPRRPLQGVSTT